MEAEVWKDIPGYEGAYQVSSLGRVRSLDRVVTRGDGRRQTVRGRILKQHWNSRIQYLYVMLIPPRRNYRVNRLVAEAFLGCCPEGQEVRHLDGNRRNNARSNLAYGTHKENMADMVAHGTRQRQCRFSPDEVREIRTLFDKGLSNWKIAGRYGVSERTIGRIRCGKVYRWVQ